LAVTVGHQYLGFRRSGGQPIELVVAAVAEPVACGVNSVTWHLAGCVTSTGDGLFVDARMAWRKWISVGDAVMHGSQPSAGGALVSGLALANGRWLLRSGGDTAVVPLPCTSLPCMAAFYGWLLCGRSLESWPFQVMSCLSG
jgi:hypothetical protein